MNYFPDFCENIKINMPKYTLSKSDFLEYLACPETFWMMKNDDIKSTPITDDILHKLEQGNLIDSLAMEWFKHHCVVEKKLCTEEDMLFQQTVESDGFLARADITVSRGEKIVDIFEVKASTRVKPEHVYDIAFQRMVFELAGYRVKNTYIIYVNNQYVKEGELDLKKIFVLQNVGMEVQKMLSSIRIQANAAMTFQSKRLIKNAHHLCGAKSDCAFRKKYCAKLPDYSVFDIARISTKKLKALIEKDTYDISRVSLKQFKFSAKQTLQIEVAKEQRIDIKRDEIKNILDGLEYPLYFLDYETYSYVIPAQDGVAPYQQMIFQYSLHSIAEQGAKPKHHEYLLRKKEEPVENLIKDLQKNIAQEGGTVIVWNKGFEKSRNKETAIMLPKYADFLNSINERVYDLMEIFSKGLYIHHAFKGRASIKKVLPVLCPELSYSDLDIQNGGAAVIQWHKVVTEIYDDEEKATIFNALLKYCELDTWAMVRIWEELGKI